MNMRYSDFPICCGAGICANFIDVSFNYYTPYEKNQKKEAISAWLKEEEKKRRDKIAFFLVILQERQKRDFGDIFIKRGYRILRSSRNPNTGHMLFLYYKDLVKTKKDTEEA